MSGQPGSAETDAGAEADGDDETTAADDRTTAAPTAAESTDGAGAGELEPAGEPVTGTDGETDVAEPFDTSLLATQFGLGLLAGLLGGSVVGIAVGSVTLGVFWGFIVGSVLGLVVAIRAHANA